MAYQLGLAYHIEFYKGKSKHPTYVSYLDDIQNHTKPTFSLPLPPLVKKDAIPAGASVGTGAITKEGAGTGAEEGAGATTFITKKL